MTPQKKDLTSGYPHVTLPPMTRPPKPRQPLQEAIAYLMAHGETLESLAMRASVSSMTVYRWQRGRQPHKAVARPLLMLAARRQKEIP